MHRSACSAYDFSLSHLRTRRVLIVDEAYQSGLRAAVPADTEEEPVASARLCVTSIVDDTLHDSRQHPIHAFRVSPQVIGTAVQLSHWKSVAIKLTECPAT
eukprot:IDg14303t1